MLLAQEAASFPCYYTGIFSTTLQFTLEMVLNADCPYFAREHTQLSHFAHNPVVYWTVRTAKTLMIFHCIDVANLALHSVVDTGWKPSVGEALLVLAWSFLAAA